MAIPLRPVAATVDFTPNSGAHGDCSGLYGAAGVWNVFDATYIDQNAGYNVTNLVVGMVVYVPCYDPSGNPLVGVVHRYRLTSLTIEDIPNNLFTGVITWDETGNPADETDQPQVNYGASGICIITERGNNLGLGFPVSTFIYTNLSPGVDIASLAIDSRSYVDQLTTKYHDVDFYQGATPPTALNSNVFGFTDAASFPYGGSPGNTDIIFKIDPKQCDFTRGVTIYAINYMDAAVASGDVNINLGYYIHENGVSYNGGSLLTLPTTNIPATAQNILFFTPIFQIPATQVDLNTSEIECKLTRLGASDTYNGNFILKHLLLVPSSGI